VQKQQSRSAQMHTLFHINRDSRRGGMHAAVVLAKV
jgi:hypothetical protein